MKKTKTIAIRDSQDRDLEVTLFDSGDLAILTRDCRLIIEVSKDTSMALRELLDSLDHPAVSIDARVDASTDTSVDASIDSTIVDFTSPVAETAVPKRIRKLDNGEWAADILINGEIQTLCFPTRSAARLACRDNASNSLHAQTVPACDQAAPVCSDDNNPVAVEVAPKRVRKLDSGEWAADVLVNGKIQTLRFPTRSAARLARHTDAAPLLITQEIIPDRPAQSVSSVCSNGDPIMTGVVPKRIRKLDNGEWAADILINGEIQALCFPTRSAARSYGYPASVPAC